MAAVKQKVSGDAPVAFRNLVEDPSVDDVLHKLPDEAASRNVR